MLPPNFRSFYLFRKGEYKYLLSGEKKQTKPNQKTPNATVPLFCTSSKSLQMTYRENQESPTQWLCPLKNQQNFCHFVFKRNKAGTSPLEYCISAGYWKEIETLKVSWLLTPSPQQPYARYLSFLCLNVHHRRKLIVFNCSSCWHEARTWTFLDVLFENVNCHLWKLLSITDLTQKNTCKKMSEKKEFWLNNACRIRSVIKKIKPIYYLAFIARDILHKS